MSEQAKNPIEILDHSAMRFRQWLVVAICIMCMALDGYDVMSISLAGAGMSAEWGLSKAELGFLLPLEFLGMAAGLIFIGTLTDLHGRRLVLMLCLAVVSIGMIASGYAPNKELLAVSRVFTGVGIGGILATGTALASEYSNAKNRTLTVILVAGGYTFGIYLASKMAGPLLAHYDWRMIFHFGALVSLVFLPIVFFLVPESIGFL
jgi:MFS family permease